MKMIELNVEKYCHDCDEFEPVASRIKDAGDYFGDNPHPNTYVRCKHEAVCKRIREYLKKARKRNV